MATWCRPQAEIRLFENENHTSTFGFWIGLSLPNGNHICFGQIEENKPLGGYRGKVVGVQFCKIPPSGWWF
jgi:hypothetical protein